MAPWWPCSLPGTSPSSPALLHLPGAFPGCCHLPPPSVLLLASPEWPKSVSGVGMELGRTGRRFTGIPRWPLNSSLGQRTARAWLSSGGPASNSAERELLSWFGKGFQGFRLHPEGSARFSLFSVPGIAQPSSLPCPSLMSKPSSATGEEWSDISGGQVGLLIYFSRENILKQKVLTFLKVVYLLHGQVLLPKMWVGHHCN